MSPQDPLKTKVVEAALLKHFSGGVNCFDDICRQDMCNDGLIDTCSRDRCQLISHDAPIEGCSCPFSD